MCFQQRSRCRLLHDVSAVDASLAFWAARLRAGQHRSFLLLGQGPLSFGLDVLAAARRSVDRHSGRLSATDQIERKARLRSLQNTPILHTLRKLFLSPAAAGPTRQVAGPCPALQQCTNPSHSSMLMTARAAPLMPGEAMHVQHLLLQKLLLAVTRDPPMPCARSSC